MENEPKNNRINIFTRLMILVIPLFAISLIFEQVGLFFLSGFLFAVFYFLFLRKYLWVLLILAPMSLCLGNIIDIPLSPTWIYEAGAAELFLIIAAFLYFLDAFLNRRIINFKMDSIAVILYLYVLASIASVLYIVDFRLFVFGMKVAIYSFLAYFLTRQLINTRQRIEWFLLGISATAIILSLQVFYKFYDMGFSSKFFFERNTILLPIGPIATTAAILALLVPVLLACYFQMSKNRVCRPFVILAATLGVTAVFLSLGKGAIASLLIGLLFLFIKLRNSRVPLMLMTLWFLFLSYVLLNPFFSGLLARVKTTFVDVNTKFRILEYKTSWDLILDNPLFGVGTGQQLHFFKKILNYDTAQLVNNYFVQAMIDLGVVGLGLVFALIIAIIVRTKKAVRASKVNNGYYLILLYGFIASLIVAFLNGLVEVTFFALSYAIIFWSMMGVFSNVQDAARDYK